MSTGLAHAVVVGAAGLGLALTVPSGAATTGLAAVVLAIGYAYDVAFKGTAWSWLPFAVGIPLLPVFGWLGSANRLPAAFAILGPVAVVAGAALAIANARADEERDAAAGVTSVALRLGSERSWALNAGLLIVVAIVAGATLVAAEGTPSSALVTASVAGAIIAAGIAIGRDRDSSRRERAWELQAIGVGLLAAAWLAGIRLGG